MNRMRAFIVIVLLSLVAAPVAEAREARLLGTDALVACGAQAVLRCRARERVLLVERALAGAQVDFLEGETLVGSCLTDREGEALVTITASAVPGDFFFTCR